MNYFLQKFSQNFQENEKFSLLWNLNSNKLKQFVNDENFQQILLILEIFAFRESFCVKFVSFQRQLKYNKPVEICINQRVEGAVEVSNPEQNCD